MGSSETSSKKLARLKRMLERQDPPRWSPDYAPAILATREEAPAAPRPAEVYSVKLGRPCHALSISEQWAISFAHYHPGLFELHEQRMLATEARPHPLTGHPRAVGLTLPSFRGTVDVADRLGWLEHHDVIYIDDPDQPGCRLPVPVPYCGDLLLFLHDRDGPYCVNWTCKLTAEGFSKPFWNGKVPLAEKTAIDSELMRHLLEEAYYTDARIRTQRVIGDELSVMSIQNLTRMFLWLPRATLMHAEDRQEVLEKLRISITMQVPPLDVFTSLHRRIPSGIQAMKTVLFQAIFNRELRVDLSQLITIDQPLRPEHTDLLVAYRHWFER